MRSTGRRLAVVAAAVIVGVIAVGLFGGVALAQGPWGGWRGGMMGGGGWGPGGNYGRMMGYGWGGRLGSSATLTDTQQFGPGYGCPGFGMMGAWGGPSGERLTTDQVQKRVADFVANYDNSSDLKAVEVMEFENNFYAQVQEKSTGVNAFELLVDPYTGNVWPEFGPNMMWNTKYGMMGRGGAWGGMMGMMRGFDWNGPTSNPSTADMTVKPDQAVKYAQDYLDAQKTGLTAETQPDTFYGYYTVHTLDKDGKTVGMLSVNGYTGRVWYHTWHGKFINMMELGG